MQKFRVGEVLKARGIIGHDIFHPIDEGDLRAATMVVLVEARDLAEVGGWSAGSGAAFEVMSQSGSVICCQTTNLGWSWSSNVRDVM